MHLRIVHNENDVPAQQASPALRNVIPAKHRISAKIHRSGQCAIRAAQTISFAGMNNYHAIDPLPRMEDLRLKRSF
jgi:hypothetical protein